MVGKLLAPVHKLKQGDKTILEVGLALPHIPRKNPQFSYSVLGEAVFIAGIIRC